LGLSLNFPGERGTGSSANVTITMKKLVGKFSSLKTYFIVTLNDFPLSDFLSERTFSKLPVTSAVKACLLYIEKVDGE
jgi:hypothetical protein